MLTWGVDPIIFYIPGLDHGIRWYGLMFAMGFAFGYYFVLNMYRAEGKPEKDVDNLLIVFIVGTIVGARLGHCLFYEPETYLREPLRILKIWEGGLASHGGLIGNVVAVYLYSMKHKDQPFLWIADRVAYPLALAGCFIRLGNFFNSEIVGKPTDLPWGIWFQRLDANEMYRHPSMLYESLSYFLIFLFLRKMYVKYQENTPRGLLIGWFFTLVFLARFLIEFTKENQVAFENNLPLNMGQLLSIPIIFFGIFLIRQAKDHLAKTQN